MATRAKFNPLATEFRDTRLSCTCVCAAFCLFSFVFCALLCSDMSEEVSSSTTSAGSKHAREDEVEAESEAPAKRQRQEDNAGPCTSSTGKSADGESGKGVSVEGGSGEGVSGEGGSGEGVASESDEEYQIGASESDGGPSDDEGNEAESSDISAEEEVEEEEGEGGGSNIICGQCVKLHEIKDGKYRLYHEESGREVKILLSQESATSAEKLAHQIQSEDQIAVLDAQDAEVTRDEGDEVIVYAKSLTAADTKYPFYNKEDTNEEIGKQNGGILLHGNKLAVLRVKGIEEMFATGDFNMQENKD